MILILSSAMVPVRANAAQIAPRSLLVSSTAAGSTGVQYDFNFTVPNNATLIQSVDIQVCDQAIGPCTTTGAASGFNAAASSLNGQPIGLGTGGAWSTANTQYAFKLTRGSATSAPSGNQTISLVNVTNPSAVNVTGVYFRITTYSDAGYVTPVDAGVTVAVVASQISVSGTMPESLVFCVGTSGTDCSNMTGSAVSLGTFTPTGTNIGTSIMSASTNAASGYKITLAGTTLTSGLNTIPAMGTQTQDSSTCAVSCNSSIGIGQYGVNVVANNVPSAGGAFGASVSGPGTGAAFGGYGVANFFRFYTGDTVAEVPTVSDTNLYTASYLVNVGGSQAAGVYTATMTYICTGNF